MENPAEWPRCNAWLRRCRECNYGYSKQDPKSADTLCPECGTPRDRCKRKVRQEGMRCSRNHGGSSPRGPASGRWKDGRYSKYLPTGISERYDEARSNHELLSLRDDLAIIEARITELFDELSGMRSEESATTWAKAKNTYKRMKRAIDEQDGATVIAAMEILDGVFEEGRSPVRIWDEILELMNKKRIMAETESRIATRERLVINVEEFNILVARTIGIIKRYVTDRTAINAIVREFTDTMVVAPGNRPGLADGIEQVVEASPWPADESV